MTQTPPLPRVWMGVPALPPRPLTGSCATVRWHCCLQNHLPTRTSCCCTLSSWWKQGLGGAGALWEAAPWCQRAGSPAQARGTWGQPWIQESCPAWAKHRQHLWCRGHTNIEITSSEVSSQLSSMDKNIKIKSRVIICSIHYILEVLTGAAELGPTPYKGQSWIWGQFSKQVELGAVLQRWTLGWTGLLQACFGVSVRLTI